MLRDEVVTPRLLAGLSDADLPRVASPRLDRPAHLTPFGRYMKAQPRLAGDRRKPCRHGLGSDSPMECVALLAQCVGLTDNTCNLQLATWWW